jgi:hypothetical protein
MGEIGIARRGDDDSAITNEDAPGPQLTFVLMSSQSCMSTSGGTLASLR